MEFSLENIQPFLNWLHWFFVDRPLPSYGTTLALGFATWVLPFQFIREDGPKQKWLKIKMKVHQKEGPEKGGLKQLVTCMICQPPYWAIFLILLYHLPFSWIFVLWGHALAIHFILDRVNPTWADLEPNSMK